MTMEHSPVGHREDISAGMEDEILVRRARPEDVDGICRVCTDGYWAAYSGLLPDEYIARTVREFYNAERVRREVEDPEGWNGWYAALDGDRVVGAGGGGMTAPEVSELFVLYVDPARRGQGIGTRLLEAITEELRRQGAREQ